MEPLSKKLRVLDFFAGIGAFDAALDRLGVDYELVDAVEIDPYAMKAFNAIHGTDFACQDITKWDKDVGHIDIMWGSFPCQDISNAGKRAGIVKGQTRSGLMYEMMRVIEKVKPRVVFAENVQGLLSKRFRPQLEEYLTFLGELGYTVTMDLLNSKNFCIPQNRSRVFIVGVRE